MRAGSVKPGGGGGGVSLGVPVASCSAGFRPLISLDLAERGALNALVLSFRLDEKFFAFSINESHQMFTFDSQSEMFVRLTIRCILLEGYIEILRYF